VKAWFKYKNGYVNYNKEFIYFSNSGNWKEIENSSELSRPIQSANWKLILIITSTISLYLAINDNWKELSVLSFLALVLSAGYAYITHYQSPAFKVQLANIEKIAVSNGEITFRFRYKKSTTVLTIKEVKPADVLTFLEWMRTNDIVLED
jgi:hypothetical protein